MCTVIQGLWEMNVQIMLLRLAPLVWCQVITSLRVGCIILLIPASCSASCNNLRDVLEKCVTLEQRWSRLNKKAKEPVRLDVEAPEK